MPDLYNLSREFELDEVILFYRGPVTAELLDAVSTLMPALNGDSAAEKKRKKVFFHILVECLQNVFHHQSGTLKQSADQTFFLAGRSPGNLYKIATGNYIPTSVAQKLSGAIDAINSMSDSEKQQQYIEQLKTTELSLKGGAGLGLIDMARKSNRKLEYELRKINEEQSFFILNVTVN